MQSAGVTSGLAGGKTDQVTAQAFSVPEASWLRLNV